MGKYKGPGSVPNRPIYSRISYLYQAAAYLASQSDFKASDTVTQASEGTGQETSKESKQTPCTHRSNHALSRRLITDLRSSSLKSQIRLSPALKHTICKSCDTLLIEGETSSSIVENKSKGGKKPWADVLVVTCHACGGVKRFPVQAPRQKRRPIREKESKEKLEKNLQETDVVMEGN
ncbi:Rpr2-domain-containing protein [Hypoxylon sp. FL0890]|nr:Rpr2-domain-containing protein [Hypoxylon sp. FL0890]